MNTTLKDQISELNRLSKQFDIKTHFKEMKKDYFEVLSKISEMTGVPIEHIVLPRRYQRITECRFLFAKWLKTHTRLSHVNIGSLICVVPCDHTTSINAINTANDLIATDDSFRNMWKVIKNITPGIDETYLMAKKSVNDYELKIIPTKTSLHAIQSLTNLTKPIFFTK